MAEIWKCVSEMTQPTRRRSSLSVAQIAERMRVSPVTVYKWGEPDGKQRIPADAVGPLSVLLQDDLLIQELARQCGGCFVPVTGSPVGFEHVGSLVKEFGEFVAELGQALDDGTINKGEASKLLTEGYEVLAALHPVLMEARRVLGEEV